MKWKRKARVQNFIAKLPENFSNKLYYFLQRNLGSLRKEQTTPIKRLIAGIEILKIFHEMGYSFDTKTFLEIGTGHRLNIPIALWLCGASKIITVDLNTYLKEELLFDDISYIRKNQSDIKLLFKKYVHKSIFKERFDKLIKSENNLDYLLKMMNIFYISPVDSSFLDLNSHSIDYHISYTVLEHIEPKNLERIFVEGKRVLKKNGLFIHHIDFSDHFSHSDNSISAINFLQFSEAKWKKYSGNRYMYHNRLRIDDFLYILKELRFNILFVKKNIDNDTLEQIKKGFTLNDKFRFKSDEVNATKNAWIVFSYH